MNRVWSDPLGELVGSPRRRAALVAVVGGIALIGAGLLMIGPTDDGPQVLGTLEERTTTTEAAPTTTTTVADDTTTTEPGPVESAEPTVPPPAPEPPPAEPAPAPDPDPQPPPAPGPDDGGTTDPRPCGEGHPVDESEEPQPGCYWKDSDNALVVEVADGEFADWTSSSTVGPRWLAFDLGLEGEPVSRPDGQEVTVSVTLTNVLDRPILFDGTVAVQVVVHRSGEVTHVVDVQLGEGDRLAPGETRRVTTSIVLQGDGRHDIHGETVFAVD